MHKVLSLFREALTDFRRNKVRTALTSLGILIGVASVVLLMGLGLGLKAYIQEQFESLGTNLIIAVPGKVLQGGGLRPGGGSLGGADFEERDVIEIKKIREVLAIAPAFVKTVSVSYRNTTDFGDLFATTEEIFAIRRLQAQKGRILTRADIEKRSRVVVIGPTIAEELYGSAHNAVGKTIGIEGQRFRVVGVMESKGGGGIGGADFDAFIYMPFSASISFNPDKTFVTMYIQARSQEAIPEVKARVQEALEKNHDEGDFSVLEQTEIMDTVSAIFSTLNLVLVYIAAISLLVGGIGIMNIMYVSVVERTKEIGIRRALGATKKDILAQFLTESILISLIGGIAGLLISFVLIMLIRTVFPAQISVTSVLIALGVSCTIGVVFGVFPARKAAQLTPVEAMRYE